MNSSSSAIHSLVSEVKKQMFSLSDEDISTFVSPSAYDTAWLAMVSDPGRSNQPLFKSCLDWVLKNQHQGGFWGESFPEGDPTIDALPATLACMIALKTWNLGEENIRKGLEFFHSKAEIILNADYHRLPSWFAIVLPGMVELALAKGLDLVVPQGPNSVFSHVLHKRQQILNTEYHADDSWQYNAPLLSFLECLPPSYLDDHEQNILNYLSEDGSLFQSPSATARAYMDTGNIKCSEYLKSLVKRQPDGVPCKYPVDMEFIKLTMVDQVQRLGLAEHFSQEIGHILKEIHENLSYQHLQPTETYLFSTKLHKDALAFRLLRMEGYHINPSSLICWFLQYPEFLEYIEKNYEHQTSMLYAVFRASDLTFNSEFELEEARSFSRKLLAKSMSVVRNVRDDNIVIFPGLQKLVERELELPWIARLDHLDHRMWIEESKNSPLWVGKASFYRLSCLNNEKLMQLSSENYKFRQSIYALELEELKRWSVESGLADIGFGRDKTTYCYFAVAASTSLPHDSIVRLMVAKIAALITVADDLYDMEASPTELAVLTDAVQRWDGKNLTGHSKTVFDALDDLVTKAASPYLHTPNGSIFLKEFRNIWKETFLSWMIEKTWSATGCQPCMDEYLRTGMMSIGAHTIVLPAYFFLGQNLDMEKYFKPENYTKITKLLMAVSRLANDTQSYQKEVLDGKLNLVLLHLKENPELHIDDSVAYVKGIVDETTKELLQISLNEVEGSSDIDHMPKAFRHLHLSCMKVFQMFFNSTNLFDTKEELMADIYKAIYIPPHHNTDQIPVNIPVKPVLVPTSPAPQEFKKQTFKTSACFEPKIKVKKYHGDKLFKRARGFLKNPIFSCDGGAVYAPSFKI